MNCWFMLYDCSSCFGYHIWLLCTVNVPILGDKLKIRDNIKKRGRPYKKKTNWKNADDLKKQRQTQEMKSISNDEAVLENEEDLKNWRRPKEIKVT